MPASTASPSSVFTMPPAAPLSPAQLQAIVDEGTRFYEQKKFDAALDSFTRVVQAAPGLAAAHERLGVVLLELKRPLDALQSLDRAIALSPGDAMSHTSRGVALKLMERHDEALAAHDRSLALDPRNPVALINRSVTLNRLGLTRAALECLLQAVAIRPDDAPAHWNMSLYCLKLGDFERGWREFEWRFRHPGLHIRDRDVPQPRWRGKEPLRGKTVLLHAEQGLGDTLQFCRYARLVHAAGGRVILEVQGLLVDLLRDMKGVADVIPQHAKDIPPFDFHAPLMSLPLAFQTQLDTVPWSGPYLRADADRLARWRARVGEGTRPRVGIVWSGNSRHPNDAMRSMRLAELMESLPAGPRYFSLQPELRAGDADALGTWSEVTHFGRELRDFKDTAAVCELMDLVISVDTSVAHLAGALARPVWMMVTADPDWRWMHHREDTPWYPSMRLYRQRRNGDWSSVLWRLHDDLVQRWPTWTR